MEIDDKRLIVILLVLLALFILASFYGCAPIQTPPLPPPRVDMAQADLTPPYRACTGAQQFDRSCAGMLTVEGYQYVLCSGDVSCLDLKNQIYCVAICLPDDHTR